MTLAPGASAGVAPKSRRSNLHLVTEIASPTRRLRLGARNDRRITGRLRPWSQPSSFEQTPRKFLKLNEDRSAKPRDDLQYLINQQFQRLSLRLCLE